MPKATARRGVRPRRLPQRTCVGCGTVSAKRQFVRIVRSPEGAVRPDPSGKAPGRGAYLCLNRSCWEQALKRKRLERALKVSLSSEDAQALAAYAEGLPTATPPGVPA